MTRTHVLCDLDHVVADAAWRDHMIPDWDLYHEKSQHDAPIEEIAYLLNALHNFGYTVIGLTGRTEKWYGLTMEWLARHKIRMDELLMRPNKDFRPAPEVKMALIESHLGYHWPDQVAFLIDDREDVCSAFAAAGVTVMQCRARMK